MSFFKKCVRIGNTLSADNVTIYAANASFFIIISVFPAMMLLMTLLQYTSLDASDLISILSQAMPQPLMPLFQYMTDELFSSSALTVISVTAVTGAWSASKGVYGVLKGLNAVYHVKESRSYVRQRLLSVFYMLLLLFALLMTLALHVFGKRVQTILTQAAPSLAALFQDMLSMRTVFVISLLTLAFTCVYLTLPNQKSRLRFTVPGAVLAAVSWVVYSDLFSFYLTNYAHYSYFYGSLTTIVVAMLWLYICMMILFCGGALNHELERQNITVGTLARRLFTRS